MANKNNFLSEEGKLYVTFSSYLSDLKAIEKRLPPEKQKRVPTIRELAQSISDRSGSGIHEMTLYNIVNNNVQLLNLNTVRMMMDEMHRRGFNINVSDFLKYVPPGDTDS